MHAENDLPGWLRDQTGSRKAQAEAMAAGCGGSCWTVRQFGESDYTIFGGGDGKPVADTWREDAGEWIAASGPASVIADCEMQLAILDEHHILTRAEAGTGAYEEFSVTGPGDSGCITCHYQGCGGVHGFGYCRTVRMLGMRYINEPGWQEQWALPGERTGEWRRNRTDVIAGGSSSSC